MVVHNIELSPSAIAVATSSVHNNDESLWSVAGSVVVFS